MAEGVKGYSPLELIALGGGALAGFAGGMHLLSPYGTLAQLAGATVGGAAGALGGKVLYNAGKWAHDYSQTDLPQKLGGGLVGTTAYFAFAPYSLLFAVPAAIVGYVFGTGIGGVVRDYTPKVAEWIKAPFRYSSGGAKNAYSSFSEPIIALYEGSKKKINSFSEGFKGWIKSYFVPKPTPAPA